MGLNSIGLNSLTMPLNIIQIAIVIIILTVAKIQMQFEPQFPNTNGRDALIPALIPACETDWTFTNSDHAAIIVTLEYEEPRSKGTTNTPKLDPNKPTNHEFKEAFIAEYLRLTRDEPAYWDPHVALEFHKCAIRSAYANTSESFNKRKTETANELKLELETLIEAIERPGIPTATENRLRDTINATRAKVYKFNKDLGQKLANRLKTKWYN